MSIDIKLRTAEQAYNEICKIDPNTALTKHYIRLLLNSGKVPITKVGRKTLVNMDDLLIYLKNSSYEAQGGANDE